MKFNLFCNSKKNNLFVVLFIIFCLSQVSFSQNRYSSFYENKFIVGINIIDDSFTKTHNAFNYDQQWNVAAYPSYFGYNQTISDNISVEGVFTMNKFKANKAIDGLIIPTERTYYAFDLSAKYNLSNIIYNIDILSNFEPFIAIGGGVTSIDNASRPTINYGVGTYIWFSLYENRSYSDSIFSNLGLIFQTMGKSSIDQQKYGNQIQHSVGIVYRF